LLSRALFCYILTKEVEQKWNKNEGDKMARILTRKGKRKTSYTVTIRVKGFDSLSRTFDTKGEARTWAAEIESKMKNQRFKDPRRAQQTLGDALDRYIETVTSQKALTTQEREKRIAKILKEKLGRNTLLPDITPSVVAKYRDQRLEVVSAYAVRLELALLSHLFLKACKEWELPLENPVKSIERPKVPKGRILFLKEDEAIRLLKECKASRNKMLYPYVFVLLQTAMRPSEAAGLRWNQIDFERRALTLLITKNEPRTVPLTKTVLEVLAKLKNSNPNNEFVFLNGEGKSLHAQNIPSSRFRPSFDKARARAQLPSLHMHDLRHTAASHMLMAGTDIRTLAAILGHSTLQMVLRYTHLLDEHKLKAVDRINSLGIE
jgi:integrase